MQIFKNKRGETGKVTAEVKGDSIVIGNDYISREFSAADDKLSTVNITNNRTDDGETVFTQNVAIRRHNRWCKRKYQKSV